MQSCLLELDSDAYNPQAATTLRLGAWLCCLHSDTVSRNCVALLCDYAATVCGIGVLLCYVTLQRYCALLLCFVDVLHNCAVLLRSVVTHSLSWLTN